MNHYLSLSGLWSFLCRSLKVFILVKLPKSQVWNWTQTNKDHILFFNLRSVVWARETVVLLIYLLGPHPLIRNYWNASAFLKCLCAVVIKLHMFSRCWLTYANPRKSIFLLWNLEWFLGCWNPVILLILTLSIWNVTALKFGKTISTL